MMSSCWMLGTLYLVLGIIFPTVYNIRNTKIIYFFIGAVESMILFVSNILIFKETRRHIKAISSSMTSNIDTTNTSVVTKRNTIRIIGNLAYDSSNTAELRKQFIQKKEIRAAYVCILMATSYYIFWIPFNVVYFTGELRTETNLSYTIYVAMTNSIADPVIYISFNRKVRSGIIKRLTQMFQNS